MCPCLEVLSAHRRLQRILRIVWLAGRDDVAVGVTHRGSRSAAYGVEEAVFHRNWLDYATRVLVCGEVAVSHGTGYLLLGTKWVFDVAITLLLLRSQVDVAIVVFVRHLFKF
jgi:hypothetical protein